MSALLTVHAGCLQAPERLPTYHTTPARSFTDPKLENERGIELAAGGDLGGAEKAFREALQRDVSYPAAHNNLGLVLIKTGRLYEAAMEFRFAARLAPASPEPHINLGSLYETAGWPHEAIAEYKRALHLSPNNALAMKRLAQAYVTNNPDSQPVDRLLEAIPERNPNSPWPPSALSQTASQDP